MGIRYGTKGLGERAKQELRSGNPIIANLLDQNTTSFTERSVPLPDEVFEQVLSRGENIDSIKSQREAAKSLGDIMSIMGSQPVQLDVSPLAGFLKASFGKDIGYKAPQTGQEKLIDLAKLQNMISNVENDATQNILRSIASGMGIERVSDVKKIQDKIVEPPPPPKPVAVKGAKPIDTEKLSKRLEGASALLPSLERLNEIASSDKAITGIGPGYALVPSIADSFIREKIGGKEGLDVWQDANNAASLLVLMRSGKAATDKEREQLLKSFGLSKNSTDAAFKSGIKKLIEETKSSVPNVYAGYPQEVIDAFAARGGLKPQDFQSAFGKNFKLKPKEQAPSGGLDAKAKARLEELRAKKAAGKLGK